MKGWLRACRRHRSHQPVLRLDRGLAACCSSCLISAGNAASRYLFSLSSNAWLEIQWQMFAGIFLLGAPHVLKLNEHVRVDLLYGGASPRRKLWIDVDRHHLLPVPVDARHRLVRLAVLPGELPHRRDSSNAGGLLLWPVKFLLPFGLALLFLQGVAELIKRIAALRGVDRRASPSTRGRCSDRGRGPGAPC